MPGSSERDVHPLRWALCVAAPALAVAAFVLVLVWLGSLAHTWAAPASLSLTAAALLAAPWAMLVAPTRAALLAGGAALLLALATAAIWWDAISGILRTT